jgi:alkylation response protein AidB-like acyl-CoA dehydrogenase
MHQPGVETRPIKLIAGNSPFCETFFTDARAEKDDMVGPLNGGWTVGKRLLQHERSGQGGGRMMAGGSVLDLAKKYVGLDEKGRIADPDLRTRITRHLIDAKAHALTMQRAAEEAKGNINPSATTSVMKNSGTWIGQEKAELTLEIMGHQGLGWEGEAYSPPEITAMRTMLRSKGNSIEGGTSEINLNVVSKRVLGLPDPK